jgi:hypothetical protein
MIRTAHDDHLGVALFLFGIKVMWSAMYFPLPACHFSVKPARYNTFAS